MPFRHTRGCAKRFGCWSINIALIIFFIICPYLHFFLLLLRLLHLLLHLRRLHLGRTRHSEEDRLSLTGAEPLKSCWRRPCLIERRRKQALLGAKCVQAHNASKRPYNDPMATEDERACFETKYVRSKIVSCIHLLGSNVCEAHMWITRYCSLLLVTRDTGIPYAGFTNVMPRFPLRYRCHPNERYSLTVTTNPISLRINDAFFSIVERVFRSFPYCCSHCINEANVMLASYHEYYWTAQIRRREKRGFVILSC